MNLFELESNEMQTRLLQTRIDSLEKHLLEIHTSICSYTRKIARMRDEGDLFATNILKFAESENINTRYKYYMKSISSLADIKSRLRAIEIFSKLEFSLRSGISNFGNCLNAIQDFRNNEVEKIEERVINEISLFGETTRRAKEELRVNLNAKNKQFSDHKEERLREMSRSTSFNEVSTVSKAYELQVQRFELKKMCDFKKIFLDFTKIEMSFHVKSIEMLTKAYNEILSIDEENDLQEFCAFFNFTQLNSPKSETPSKCLDRTELSSTLRRFNSTPNFSISSIKSNSLDNKNESDSDIEEESYSLIKRSER